MPIRYLHSLCLLVALLLPGPSVAEPDPRRSFTAGESPDWLRAVGRLVVPGIKLEDGRRRHHTERCSATLIQSHRGQQADTIVTAWHCLEYYEDLSQRILFQLTDSEGQLLEIEARHLADGGDIDADWAIMRLQQAVPAAAVPALAVSEATSVSSLVMAGFSRDSGIGMAGRQLSYDPACEITREEALFSDSNCRAYKGASGGAVIQLDSDGTPELTGVISQGDGEGLSRYIPVGIFRRTLLGYL
ncbi:trypsin-like serine peptidase [Parahaliea aestuarii]|uniref:Trypsin-like serine protease n=1 Tax=Parahaliea aestuarii TaxID=1852021 RepID=A0A5C9A0Y2_9GAMM|nr:trypsin-like peptidase domain-containing protein [Parahaliea aestuarii]TXS93430.1 trypsin-like serine protease [Parahaliea aestuarii]